MKDFEATGKWYLPNKSRRKVAGILRFSKGKGAWLDLIGSLTTVSGGRPYIGPDTHIDIVLGTTSGNKKVTLYGCSELPTRFPLDAAFTDSYADESKVYSNVVLVGEHFKSKAQIKFNEVIVEYSFLDVWAGITGFDIKQPSATELEIKYKTPAPFLIANVDGIEVSIKTRAKTTRRSDARKELTIGEGTQLRLSFKKAKPYDECIRIIYRVANFLCIAAKNPVYPLAIVGVTKDDQTVDIFYQEEHAQNGLGPIIAEQMVFVLKGVEERIEDLLVNWFKKASEIEPILDLYFGTLYNPKLYLNHRFLSLVQALEAYHRRTTMKNYLDKPEDHEKRLKEILGSISNEKHRKWLQKKLNHSNEPFLVIRLSSLVKKFKDILERKNGDWDSLPKKVSDTRNYLTHLDPSKEASAATADELVALTKQLRLLLELVLLTEIGFSLDEISWLRVDIS